jgi:hypothetical protein
VKSDDKDQDMKGVPAALTRAGKRAREIARQTGTEIVVVRDGKVVREKPSEANELNNDKTA